MPSPLTENFHDAPLKPPFSKPCAITTQPIITAHEDDMTLYLFSIGAMSPIQPNTTLLKPPFAKPWAQTTFAKPWAQTTTLPLPKSWAKTTLHFY